MSDQSTATVEAGSAPERREPPAKPAGPRRLSRALSFRNISAVYLFAALLVLYAIWVPDTFLTGPVWRSLLDNGALTTIAAIGLTLPLAAGVFNLSIGAEIGFAAILVAWALTKLGASIPVSMALTLVVGGVIGVVSGTLITRGRIPSFITTLGMSSVLAALTAWLSNSEQILNLGSSFQSVGTGQLLGVTYPVWIALVLAGAVYYVLERTSVGRRIYATGGNESAARLSGVATSTIIVAALAACGAIAGLAGALASSRLATGDPTIGPAYLLPAYAAVFLGSTQFRGGRYNVWGTVLGVYVLAVGVKGLQLAGAPVWIPDLFNGVALLLAVGLSRLQRRASSKSALRRRLDQTQVRANEASAPTGAAQ